MSFCADKNEAPAQCGQCHYRSQPLGCPIPDSNYRSFNCNSDQGHLMKGAHSSSQLECIKIMSPRKWPPYSLSNSVKLDSSSHWEQRGNRLWVYPETFTEGAQTEWAVACPRHKTEDEVRPRKGEQTEISLRLWGQTGKKNRSWREKCRTNRNNTSTRYNF